MFLKKRIWLLFFIIFYFCGTALGQEAEVIKYYPEKRLAIINQGLRHNIEQGAVLTVYREISGKTENIAKVKITKVVGNYSVVRILFLDSERDVAVGDKVSSSIDYPTFSETANEQNKRPIKKLPKQQLITTNKQNDLAWGLISLGIVSASLSTYWQFKVNRTFNKYETATTPDDASRFRKEVEKNQKWRNVSLIGTGISALTGVALLYMNKKNNPKVKAESGKQSSTSKKLVSLVPHFHPDQIGVNIKVYF